MYTNRVEYQGRLIWFNFRHNLTKKHTEPHCLIPYLYLVTCTARTRHNYDQSQLNKQITYLFFHVLIYFTVFSYKFYQLLSMPLY